MNIRNKIILSKEQVALGQIFIVFVLPVLLIYYNIISKDFRMIILLVMSLFVYGVIRKEKWTNEMIGLSDNTFKKYFLPYIYIITIGTMAIIMYARSFDMDIQESWWTNPHFLFLFIVVSFLQEFTYRGFLIPKLKVVFTDQLGIVLINALLFTLLHIIFPVPQIMLPLAFIGGLAFSVLYMKYPNLILISIAHSVFNFIAVLHGFFTMHF